MPYLPPYAKGVGMNEREIEALERHWEKVDRATVDSAVAALLDHENGRKLLWWLLQLGKVGIQPFTNNALVTSFSCGELNVGNQILARIIEVNPAGYVRMMEEQNAGSELRDEQLARARRGDALAGDGSGDPPDD